jgi:putative ABC transport system permease protein
VIAFARYALRSLARRPVTSACLAVCLGIAVGLPFAVGAIVETFQREIAARADAAPLVLGAQGSDADLVLHSLFFRHAPPGAIQVRDKEELDRLKLSESVPLCIRASIRDVPVVGTDGSYFRLRKLTLASGTPIARLGDCVVGANAAERLGVEPGSRIATSPTSLFSGNGGTPVRLSVRGVLARTGTADDDAAFVSLETAWLIEGLGHGHANPEKSHGEGETPSVASGFIEVTDENFTSFHFHGRRERFPLTAVIAIPRSEKDRLLLIAHYTRKDSGPSLVESQRVLQDLLDVAVRVRTLIEAVTAVMALATCVLCVAIIALTMRLRSPELAAMYRLGIPRSRILLLYTLEFLFVGIAALAIGSGIVMAATILGPSLFRAIVG